jgi:uncharacterized protein YndB with AHSA1/START domain
MAEKGSSTGAAATSAKPNERELVMTRVLDAPRELVFRVWTERQHLLRWWGPKDFTTTFFEVDLRPGGAWRARMRSPDGTEYSQHGVFREIVEPERLVFTFTWGDDPDHEMLVAVTFVERGAKTEMTFRQGVFRSVESRDSHEEGWSECFDRLREYLAQR